MKWAEIYMLIVLAKIGKSSSPCSIVNDCLLWQIAHMYVCMYVCLSVCMYVCMCIYIYICWCSNWTWWFSIALLNYWRVKLNFPCSNGSFFPSWVLLIWNARIIQWFQNEHNIVSQCSPYIYIYPFCARFIECPAWLQMSQPSTQNKGKQKTTPWKVNVIFISQTVATWGSFIHIFDGGQIMITNQKCWATGIVTSNCNPSQSSRCTIIHSN